MAFSWGLGEVGCEREAPRGNEWDGAEPAWMGAEHRLRAKTVGASGDGTGRRLPGSVLAAGGRPSNGTRAREPEDTQREKGVGRQCPTPTATLGPQISSSRPPSP